MINAGAWTHYSRAIADALELTDLPAVEVHLSDVESRQDWRRESVFDGLVLEKISGKGPDGYRDALADAGPPSGRLGPAHAGSRRPARGRAGRARARPDPGHRPGQRPLPDRFHGHQRRLRLRPRDASLPHRLPLHRARRSRGRGLGDDHRRDDWLGGIAAHLSGRVGFEDDHVSVRLLERLRAKLAEGAEPVAAGGAVEKLRRVKDEAELAAIAAASELADEVWRWSVERGLGGRPEREVARAAEARIRELGGDPSFPAIVAAGPNGALPHAEPGERPIGSGELVVFDMGAKLDGYCSDGTRTFAVGEPGERAREVYEDGAQRPGGGARRGRRRDRRRGARRGRARARSSPPATATISATASATGSASRCTRRRASRRARRTCSQRAKW